MGCHLSSIANIRICINVVDRCSLIQGDSYTTQMTAHCLIQGDSYTTQMTAHCLIQGDSYTTQMTAHCLTVCNQV
jgi:hypothetical protein